MTLQVFFLRFLCVCTCPAVEVRSLFEDSSVPFKAFFSSMGNQQTFAALKFRMDRFEWMNLPLSTDTRAVCICV